MSDKRTAAAWVLDSRMRASCDYVQLAVFVFVLMFPFY